MLKVYTIAITEQEHEIVLTSLLKSATYYVNKAEHAEARGDVTESCRWKDKHEDAEALRQRFLDLVSNEGEESK